MHDLSSLLVALLALYIAIRNARVQREHQRLSVKPKLICWRIFRGPSHKLYGFKLINNGLGPAEITSIQLYLDGSIIDSDHNAWSTVIKNVGLNSSNWNIWRPSPGVFIRSGEELWLFHTESLDRSANETIRSLSRLRIKIGYKSMYNEEQPIFESELAKNDQIIVSEERMCKEKKNY